jgi:hypothetical protein
VGVVCGFGGWSGVWPAPRGRAEGGAGRCSGSLPGVGIPPAVGSPLGTAPGAGSAGGGGAVAGSSAAAFGVSSVPPFTSVGGGGGDCTVGVAAGTGRPSAAPPAAPGPPLAPVGRAGAAAVVGGLAGPAASGLGSWVVVVASRSWRPAWVGGWPVGGSGSAAREDGESAAVPSCRALAAGSTSGSAPPPPAAAQGGGVAGGVVSAACALLCSPLPVPSAVWGELAKGGGGTGGWLSPPVSLLPVRSPPLALWPSDGAVRATASVSSPAKGCAASGGGSPLAADPSTGGWPTGAAAGWGGADPVTPL